MKTILYPSDLPVNGTRDIPFSSRMNAGQVGRFDVILTPDYDNVLLSLIRHLPGGPQTGDVTKIHFLMPTFDAAYLSMGIKKLIEQEEREFYLLGNVLEAHQGAYITRELGVWIRRVNASSQNYTFSFASPSKVVQFGTTTLSSDELIQIARQTIRAVQASREHIRQQLAEVGGVTVYEPELFAEGAD